MEPAYPLAGLRVLELPGVATAVTGKCFADLGADVVRVVPAGGDPLERVGPFVPVAGGERSAPAIAYNLGKRLATIDIATDAGRAELLAAARESAVVVHELTAAGLDECGLGELRALAEAGTVVVGITPFGATGPLSGWRGSDLVQFAMGGYLYMTGERDGRPLQPSAPMQTYLHGGVQAFAASLVALRRRRLTGQGSWIDLSLRDTGAWMLTHTYQHWDMQRVTLRRNGSRRDMGARRRLRVLFDAKDGHLVWMFTTGHLGAEPMRRLVTWMADDGADVSPFAGIDWAGVDILEREEDLLDRFEAAFQAFFATKTKAEMLAWASANGLMLAPVATIADVWTDPQLAAREAWCEREVPGVGRLRLPGPPIRVEGVAWVPREGPAEADAKPVTAAGAGAVGGGDAARPLAGVRVLDLGTTLAAPTAGRHLADLGAEVIRVESSVHPDTLRVGTPYAANPPGLDSSGYFAAYNAGKLSVAVDLRQAAGRDVLRRLAEQSDVLIQNFTPGVLERLGIPVETIRSWNPRLVVAGHCLSGQTGPRRSQRGYGQVAGAMTGWYDLTGEEGGEPIGPYSAYTDFLSWPYLCAAVVLALEARDATGRAPAIDHAQIESSLHFLAPLLVEYQLTGRVPTRHGDHRPDVAPNNVYRCAGEDRWVAISVLEDAQWPAVCEELALPAALAGLASAAERLACQGEIDAAIDAAVVGEEAWAVARRLQARGVAAGPVLRAEDLFGDEQLVHRGLFRRLDHAVLGDHAVITNSFRIAGVDHGPHVAAPLLGEHTFEVLTRVLGMGDEEIAELVGGGVLV
ncbi:MAG: CoA transferase [Dehalococcoidia bacterium]|nr:CoA transferase [Dehalococcoidia bacterium]